MHREPYLTLNLVFTCCEISQWVLQLCLAIIRFSHIIENQYRETPDMAIGHSTIVPLSYSDSLRA